MKRARASADYHEEEMEQLDAYSRSNFAKLLRAYIVRKYIFGDWNAEDICELCHHITQSGGSGVQDIALDPASRKSGHGSRQLKRAVGTDGRDEDLEYVETPVYIKKDTRRSVVPIALCLPSKEIRENVCIPEFLESPDLPKLDSLQSQLEGHPAFERAMELKTDEKWIRPIALYADGVQYTKQDSFFGISVIDLLTGLSFLCVLLRALAIFNTEASYCFEPKPRKCSDKTK